MAVPGVVVPHPSAFVPNVPTGNRCSPYINVFIVGAALFAGAATTAAIAVVAFRNFAIDSRVSLAARAVSIPVAILGVAAMLVGITSFTTCSHSVL